MVTGASGFVGAHSVRPLVDAGHDARLLVRDVDRARQNLEPLGVDGCEFVVGDMTDSGAVAEAVDGCEAVLHCAAVVSLDRRRAEEVVAANPRGTEIVVEAAAERGLDPIVYTSSAAALFGRGVGKLHAELPPAAVKSAYGRSKALAEEYVRRRQADGVPITITYPGGVTGPPAGTAFGEFTDAVVLHLEKRALPTSGTTSVIDVRDLGAVHAAAMEPGHGPRRFMCGGRLLTMRDFAGIYHELTGRRFSMVPAPGFALRGLGRIMDGVRRVVPVDSVFTTEGMTILTRWRGSDDGAVQRELGVTFRDVRETLADAIRGLLAAGRITPKQAGRLADEVEVS